MTCPRFDDTGTRRAELPQHRGKGGQWAVQCSREDQTANTLARRHWTHPERSSRPPPTPGGVHLIAVSSTDRPATCQGGLNCEALNLLLLCTSYGAVRAKVQASTGVAQSMLTSFSISTRNLPIFIELALFMCSLSGAVNTRHCILQLHSIFWPENKNNTGNRLRSSIDATPRTRAYASLGLSPRRCLSFATPTQLQASSGGAQFTSNTPRLPSLVSARFIPIQERNTARQQTAIAG